MHVSTRTPLMVLRFGAKEKTARPAPQPIPDMTGAAPEDLPDIKGSGPIKIGPIQPKTVKGLSGPQK